MGETGKESYNSEMKEAAEKITKSIAKSIVISSYAYRLLDLVIPYRFLGITGQMRRNTYALQLGADLANGLITSNGAIEKLRMFDENFFSEIVGPGINGGWEQLSLWSQSELDQI